MKIMDWQDTKSYVPVKITCDDCGTDCGNTSVELHMKMCFSEQLSLHKTLCLKCWIDKYKDDHCKRRDEMFQAQIDYMKAKKEGKA